MIGTALKHTLIKRGDSVKCLVRRPTSNDSEISWDPKNRILEPSHLHGVDAVINLAGAGIADRRWSTKQMNEILMSRVNGTELISETISKLDPPHRPMSLINASAIGFYGNSGLEAVTEKSSQGGGFVADVCKKWEDSTLLAEKAETLVAHARIGIVLSPSGGVLKKLLPIFKFGLGGRIGSGNQLMSWISLHDVIDALCWILDTKISGPVNLVSPNPVSNLDFSKTLASTLKRPALIPVPPQVLMLLRGRQLVEELILSSQCVVPEVLLKNDFKFSHNSLKEALLHELKI